VHVSIWHWSADWPALACYLAAAAAHLAGLRGAAPPVLRRQVFAFQGGLLVALAALVSPVGYLADSYLWLRMLQFLLLGLVAPGLIVLGAPWTALRVARHRLGPAGPRGEAPRTPLNFTRGEAPRTPLDFTRGEAPRTPLNWLLGRPVLAVAAVNMAWLGWLVPAAVDQAERHGAIAAAQQVTWLAAGVVFWLALIGSRPYSPAALPLRRFALVAGTAAAITVFGMILVFGSAALYPAYANSAHHVMTVLDDQQLAGAVLWMGSLPALATVGVALLLRWLSEEEESAAELDRLLAPRASGWRTHAWPTRPGIR
jgi:cytochrome c oxidase assembly factor CtaG